MRRPIPGLVLGCFVCLGAAIASASFAQPQNQIGPGGNPGGQNQIQPPPGGTKQGTQLLGVPLPWTHVDGCARAISVGEVDRPWAIGCGAVKDNFEVFRWSGAAWVKKPGSGVAVVGAPPAFAGTPTTGDFLVTSDFRLLMGGLDASGARDRPLTVMGNCIREIAVGSVGWEWAIGCAPVEGRVDGAIFRRRGAPADFGPGVRGYGPVILWDKVPGSAFHIAVGIADGEPWALTQDGRIFKTVPKNCSGIACAVGGLDATWEWQKMPGCATAIASGGNSRVWAIGCDADAAGNGGVFQWNGRDWTRRAGAATRIAVDALGRPWAVQADGSVFRWNDIVPAPDAQLVSDPRPGALPPPSGTQLAPGPNPPRPFTR